MIDALENYNIIIWHANSIIQKLQKVRYAFYILATNDYFDYFILTVVVVNSVFMAIDGNILKQMFLKTPNGQIKETFLFSIINNLTKSEVNILTNKKLYNQQLLDYQKYLKDLQKKENWMELLILGMNIYQGKMTALNGIPLKIKERKKIIGEYLQDLISQFLFTNAGSQQLLNYFDPSLENARIEKNMEITIEFCIEIDSVDYLLDKILKIYESKKYKDIFLSKLEPFILCNKMRKFEIPEEIILDLIKLY